MKPKNSRRVKKKFDQFKCNRLAIYEFKVSKDFVRIPLEIQYNIPQQTAIFLKFGFYSIQ
jgi:hypothetical protein